MRFLTIALGLAACGLTAPAAAQSNPDQLRLKNLQAGPREHRVARSSDDWRQFARYDFNRVEPGQHAYFADRYYRDGRSYSARQLAAADRVYVGSDERLYCRRDDGTTGRIVRGGADDRLNPGDTRLVGELKTSGMTCR